MIDEGPQLARIRYEAGGHYYGLKLFTGEAKRGINNMVIEFDPGFYQSAPRGKTPLTGSSRVAAVEPKPSARFQNAQYFRKRPGLSSTQ